MKTKEHLVRAKVWVEKGEAAWHFISLPTDVSDALNFEYGLNRRHQGGMPVKVTVGETTWDTSLYPETKMRSYLLPLNARVRKAENIKNGTVVYATVSLRIP